MKSRTTWREKLERQQEPKIVAIPPKMQKRFGQGSMLIPRPLDVDALIRGVPKGRVVTQSALRRKLAEDCNADVACPFTTGIFIRIAAEAAEEDLKAGKRRITPYWRVVRDNGAMIEKLPGGPLSQATRLSSEGVQMRNGCVADLERVLMRL